MDTTLLTLAIIFPLIFQMAALNFNHILLKLANQGSIPWDTLQSQGSTWGTFTSVPCSKPSTCSTSLLTACRDSSPRVHSCPPTSEGTLKLSGITAILLIFQADNQHEKITDVYVGLVVHHVESCLYAPDQILDFVSNIEVDLKVAHNALKAGCDPGKRCAFCLFINNYGGAMSIPMDQPYCLIYLMSYMKDVELDLFDTHNNLARTCLHHCICCTTLQHMNDNPNQCREYSGSPLILPHGAQYKE